MKIPRTIYEAAILPIHEEPDDFALSIDSENADRIRLAFNVCGEPRYEPQITAFYDRENLQAPDFLLPPELAFVTLDSLNSIREEGTTLVEVAKELRGLYLAEQRRKIDALNVERLKFELDAVKLDAECILRRNPQDGGSIVGFRRISKNK